MPDQEDALARLEYSLIQTDGYGLLQTDDIRSVVRECRARRKFCDKIDKCGWQELEDSLDQWNSELQEELKNA